MSRFLMLGLVVIGACKDDASTDDTATDDSVVENPEAPVLSELEAYCYLHDTGDQFYQWVVHGRADDPQGVDTLSSMGKVEVYRETAMIADYDIVVSTRDGEVVGSFRETDDNVICDNAETYDFEFVISDVDGNETRTRIAGARQ